MAALVGLVALIAIAVTNLAAVAGAGHAVARRFGLRARFPFRYGDIDDHTSRWVGPCVGIAGTAASYLCAALLFSVGHFAKGKPAQELGTTVNVIEGGPAAEAGVMSGD